MEGIEDETVLFKPTYDGTSKEPLLLPARFPYLLANGAMGIAVGMATNIPPHNNDEICAALLYLMEHPECETKDLLIFINGPDFPTGGVIIHDQESFEKAYETGRGRFRLRALWEKEETKGGGYSVIVTEIPYHVQKTRLIEKMAELLENKKLPLLGDLRDESAVDVRLVLIPKNRHIDPVVFMESLFQETDLEVRIPLNMNVLDSGGIPRVMSLKEVLNSFLAYRLQIILSQTSFKLRAVQKRLDILKGLLIAFLNLDDIIQIIREEDNPSLIMMERFNLSEDQAEAILNMRLRSLRRLEENDMRQESLKLEREEKELQALLSHEKSQKKALKADILWIQKKFGTNTPLGKRRSQFGSIPKGIDPFEQFIEKEPMTVCCSENGWIRALGGHLSQEELLKTKYKEGDKERFILNVMRADKLLIGTTKGRFYTLSVDKIPRGKGYGEPLQLLLDLMPGEDIIGIEGYAPENQEKFYVILATDGRGFKIKGEHLVAQTKAGKQILTCPEGVAAFGFYPLFPNITEVALLGSNQRLLLLKTDTIPFLSKGRGSILQKYRGGFLKEACLISLEMQLGWKIKDKKIPLENPKYWRGSCGSIGKLVPESFQKEGRLVTLLKV